jgi:hypothetical protein
LEEGGFLNWIEGSIETIVTERSKEIANKISKLKEKYKKIYVGVPDAIARHGYLFDLYSCSTGIPVVDPFPPISGHHRSGYEKREQPTRQYMTEEGREGESDENAANRILNMIGQVIASLNPEYNNQVGCCSSRKNSVGFISSNVITKNAIVNKYNITHRIACGVLRVTGSSTGNLSFKSLCPS